MEKRYQVFVSSTFEDLKDERQAVLRAILELNHMPAGMELFPATDEAAWDLIKDVIDASDYYVLIVGGRYGSLDEEGLGYTEKEYDYAVRTKKPVVPLLHKNPDNLPRGKTETDKAAWEKLIAFRDKIEARHTCVYWETADELKARVVLGLTSTIKRRPAKGWVRADEVPTEADAREVLRLREQIAKLEREASAARTEPPPGTEDLVGGEDDFEVPVVFIATAAKTEELQRYSARFTSTWNEVFAAVAPSMIGEISERELRTRFNTFVQSGTQRVFGDDEDIRRGSIRDVRVSGEAFDTFLVQIRALGLISQSVKQRSVKDKNTYWTLTPYGDTVMTQLRALRRTPRPSEGGGGAKKPTDD